MWDTNYHIVLDYFAVRYNKHQAYATRILNRKYISEKFDLVTISGIGRWLYNKFDNEFVRTFKTPMRRTIVLLKLAAYGVDVKRLSQNTVRK